MYAVAVRAFLPLVAFFLGPGIAAAQLQLATIRGVVLDVQRSPVADATVILRDDLGHDIARGTTQRDGSFQIRDVALGSYQLRVEVGRAVLLTQVLVVRGSLPIELTLQTGGVVQEQVVVRGDAASNTPEHPWSLAGAALRTVAAVPTQQL